MSSTYDNPPHPPPLSSAYELPSAATHARSSRRSDRRNGRNPRSPRKEAFTLLPPPAQMPIPMEIERERESGWWERNERSDQGGAEVGGMSVTEARRMRKNQQESFVPEFTIRGQGIEQQQQQRERGWDDRDRGDRGDRRNRKSNRRGGGEGEQMGLVEMESWAGDVANSYSARKRSRDIEETGGWGGEKKRRVQGEGGREGGRKKGRGGGDGRLSPPPSVERAEVEVGRAVEEVVVEKMVEEREGCPEQLQMNVELEVRGKNKGKGEERAENKEAEKQEEVVVEQGHQKQSSLPPTPKPTNHTPPLSSILPPKPTTAVPDIIQTSSLPSPSTNTVEPSLPSAPMATAATVTATVTIPALPAKLQNWASLYPLVDPDFEDVLYYKLQQQKPVDDVRSLPAYHAAMFSEQKHGEWCRMIEEDLLW